MEKVILGGKEILVRKLVAKDIARAKDHLAYFDALLDEDLYISTNKRMVLKEEKSYLKDMLALQKKGKCVYLVSEYDGKVISHVEARLKEDKSRHIAVLGFAIAAGFRHIGLGGRLWEILLSLCQTDLSPKPRIIEAGIFVGNIASLGLAKKFGFRQVARLPNQFIQKGQLIDEIIVQLYL